MDDSFENFTDDRKERNRSVVAWCAAISFFFEHGYSKDGLPFRWES